MGRGCRPDSQAPSTRLASQTSLVLSLLEAPSRATRMTIYGTSTRFKMYHYPLACRAGSMNCLAVDDVALIADRLLAPISGLRPSG